MTSTGSSTLAASSRTIASSSQAQAVGTALNLTLHSQTDPETMVQMLKDIVKTQRENRKVIQEVHFTVDPTYQVGVLMTEKGRK